MKESRVKRENYIVIQGWMISDLNLKGNELLVYAIIFGFSQSESQKYTGSLQYLADWTNSTTRNMRTCLQSLEAKGLIKKTDIYMNNVKFCEYECTQSSPVGKKVPGGAEESSAGGREQTSPNNLSLDNQVNNLEQKKERKSDSFDTLIDEYCSNLSEDIREKVRGLLKDWLKVRKAKRAAMTDKAIELNLNKLTETASESGMGIAKYLEEVICRGWQAFFPIKNYSKANGSKGQQEGEILGQYNRMMDRYGGEDDGKDGGSSPF